MSKDKKKRKLLPDYLEVHFEAPLCVKWVSDVVIRDRRVCLRGIDISLSVHGKKPVEMSPVIPCMGPALKLLKENPELCDITFNRTKKIWEPSC